MKIALASDHAGFEIKEKVKNFLNEHKYQVVDFGTFSNDSFDYPDSAYPASKSVATADSDFGILICGTGTGKALLQIKSPESEQQTVLMSKWQKWQEAIIMLIF